MIAFSKCRITLGLLGVFVAVLIFSMPWSVEAALNSSFGLRTSGPQVTELQQTLTNLGYYSGPVTGYFGSLTKASVIQFQKANNISPQSGYFGPLTRAELNGGVSISAGAAVIVPNSALPNSTSPVGTTNLPTPTTQSTPSPAPTPSSVVLVVPGMDLSRTLFQVYSSDLSLPQQDSGYVADNLKSFLNPQKGSDIQIITFTDWDRDIKDTENAVNELKNEILVLSATAQSSSPKATFNIVAHSWGGVLTYAALTELAGQIHVDNLFTLGTPIGSLANPILFPMDKSQCLPQVGLSDISGILCPNVPNSIRGKTIEGRPEGVDQWINFWSRGDMFSYELAFSKHSSKIINYQYDPGALPQSPPLYCGMLGGMLFNNQLPECHKFVQSVQDAHKEYYDWTNVNITVSNVAKEVLGKIDKILKGSNLPNIPVFQTLNVSLSANPSSATAGQSVSLTANVSGTAQGTIHYQFDCTNNGGYEVDVVNNTDPYTTSSCGYSSPGTYIARVHVERGTASPIETTARITVSALASAAQPSPQPQQTAPPPSSSGGGGGGAGSITQPSYGMINSHLSVTPTSGRKGTIFTLTGSGFTPGGSIKEMIYGSYPDIIRYITADQNGSYSDTYDSSLASLFEWPSATYGIYGLDVTSGRLSNDAKAVNITITANQDSALQALILASAPSNSSATALSSSRIAFVWHDNSDNESGFKIERKSSGGTYTQINMSDTLSSTGSGGYYEDSGLSAGTNYCYRVRAHNSAGDSDYSNEACASTQAVLAVSPATTTGSATAITSNFATLNATVNPNGAATGVFFQWSNSSSTFGNTTSSQVIGSGVVGVNVSANLTGLTPATVYYFRIVATNNSGGTIFGATQTFTTSSVPAPAPAPTSVPDLVVDNVKINPSVTRAGNSITVSFIVRNQGNGTANASTAKIRLSLDSTITASDPTLGEVVTPAISSGTTVSLTKSLTIPAGTASALYYVGVTADVNSTTGQTNKSNDNAVQFLSIY